MVHIAACPRWLLACATWIMNRTERPRRWIAVRSRPVLARLDGPLGRLAVPGRRVLTQVDRVQQWMPGISRRGILGLTPD